MEKSERGFYQGDVIPGEYGGHIRAYVSSGNTPALWVRIQVPEPNTPAGPIVEDATILLTLEDVKSLEEQLRFLRENHFLA
jgi:hypothetical protein